MTQPPAQSARDETLAKAAEIGVTPDYIYSLVDSFYERVHADETLGPIFDKAIGDSWDHHLSQMKDFWTSVALGAGVYSGKPVPAHRQHLQAIKSEHFDIWLGLFQKTLEDTAPSEACVEHFMVRAHRIAKSLKLAMFGIPGLGAPKYEA